MFLFIYKVRSRTDTHKTHEEAWDHFETLTVSEFPDIIVEINDENEVRTVPVSTFFDEGPRET